MEDRSCHDLFFLLLFIAFWVGMFYVADQAVKNGQPDRFIYGVDYEGNVCGINNVEKGIVPAEYAQNFSHSNYLYFMPASTELDSRGYIDICVEACPNATYFPPTSTDEVLCPYNTTPSLEPPCYGTFDSKPLLHRCVPQLGINVTEVEQAAINALNLQQAADLSLRIFGTLVRAWKYIAVGAAGSLVLSLFWLFLMSKFAGILVYLTIILVHVVLAVLAYLVYHTMQDLDTDYNNIPAELRLVSEQELITALKVIFIALIVLLVLTFLGTLCMWQRISIAIGVIEEASIAMIHIPTILLVPIGTGACIVLLAVYWFFIGAYLGTTGKPTYNSSGQFEGYQSDSVWIRMQLYHLFGGMWALAFLHAVSDCVIAGAIASWYWVHDKKDVPRFPVASSLWRVIRYSLGSLMFGSLILAIVQFARFLLHQLEKRVKAKNNEMVKCLFKCVNCLLFCFEKFIKFLDKNAYIMISIYGYSFCQGAKRGFGLLADNFLRVAALNCVGGFIVFLGKLFVCILTALIAFIVLKRNSDDIGDYVIPTVAIGILAYAISVAFFNVFDIAMDTLLLCFCEDTERNDGVERPYYMSENLKKHMGKDHKSCCC
jgi:hypothetical protein